MADPNNNNDSTDDFNSGSSDDLVSESAGSSQPGESTPQESRATFRDGNRKTVVRRGNNKTADALSASTVELESSGKSSGKASLMTSDDIGATINTRELTADDAGIWATAIADAPVEQVTGIQSTGFHSTGAVNSGGNGATAETLDPSQIQSTTGIGGPSDVSGFVSTRDVVSKGGGEPATAEGTAEIPAIERTVSERNFDRLRRCELTPLKTDPKPNSDYRLIRKLGQGGMGDVFVARQGSLDRLLALKLIKPLDGKRRRKLMQTGRLEEVEQERRMQFLSEAIVTGDLDHPNIVPIHDVAFTGDGNLFYSMKRVIGTPWSEEIESMSVDENLEVLLKVCDAIALAHTRGVVHRDIKPENIMLGEFGVVMVMDWGLALPTARYLEKRESALMTSTGLGGTPAFMSPEMATGPVDRIGTAADIYLLGATLFMIVTGKAPHHASTVTECLKAVRENRIREVEPHHEGELLQIAYRAMKTNPADRYSTVMDFQQAIRDFVKHAGSIQQSHQATESLESGIQNASYEDFSKARYQYEAALRSWSDNVPAAKGLDRTRVLHAETALAKEDFDLGLSLLDENRSDHQELIQQLQNGKKQRASREAGLRMMKKLAAAMLAFIVVGASVAVFVIEQKRKQATEATEYAQRRSRYAEEQKNMALRQKEIADEQTIEANRQREIANQETIRAEQLANAEAAAKKDAVAQALKARQAEKEAVAATLVAEEAKQEAIDERKEAVAATRRANYEEYVSKIGLAKARLDRNESEVAREILQELKDKSPFAGGWEWRWLWRQADGSESKTDLEQSAIDFSASPDGKQGAVLVDGGQVRRWRLKNDTGLHPSDPEWLQVSGPLSNGADLATAVAVSQTPDLLATGHASGRVVVHQSGSQWTIGTHAGQVNDLVFAGKRFLVSGSQDRTVRVWDVQAKSELTAAAACWHDAPVLHVAAVLTRSGGGGGVGDRLKIAAATSRDSLGLVDVWGMSTQGDNKPTKLGQFEGHRHPVSCITFGRNGKLAASGDNAGNVLVWNPSSIQPVDYESEIKNALASMDSQAANVRQQEERRGDDRTPVKFVRLIDRKLKEAAPNTDRTTLVSTSDANLTSLQAQGLAHSDVVRSIAFDATGQQVVSASNDYTVKAWDVNQRVMIQQLKGHGGWVTGASFATLSDPEFGPEQQKQQQQQPHVVSASRDRTLRVWNLASYTGDSVEPELPRTANPHRGDISSACFSPDGSRILTASGDHTASLMTIDRSTLAFRDTVELQQETESKDRLKEGSAYVAMSMGTDQANRYLYVGSADATVRIWDIARGVQCGEVTGTGLSDVIAVSGDGTLLLTGASSPKVKAILWKVDPAGNAKPKQLHRLQGHDQAVTAMAISRDGSRLFTGDGVGYGLLWDAKTGQPIGKPIENVRGFRINAAQFSPDGRSIWLGADDGQLTQIDLASQAYLRRLDHSGFVTDLTLSDDQRYAVTIAERLTQTQLESRAMLWDLSTGESTMLAKAIDVLQGESATKADTNLRSNRRSGDRKRITSVSLGRQADSIMVGQNDGEGRSMIKIWKDASGVNRQPDQSFALPPRLGTVQNLATVSGGRCLTLNQNAAFAWDLSSGQLLHSYRAHARLTEASFSPDGKWVATASRSIKIWDASNGEASAKIESPHRGPVRCVQFQPATSEQTEYRFATGGDDGRIAFWRWSPKQTPVQESVYHVADGVRIHWIRYSKDARRMLVGGDGGVVRMLELELDDTASPVTSFTKLDVPESDADMLCGSISPDGNCIAIGSNDSLGRVWNVQKDGSIDTQPTILAGHADSIEGIHVAGDSLSGYRVFTASADDSVKVWDPRQANQLDSKPTSTDRVKQGREMLSLRKHRGDVTAVDLSPDGRLLMTAGKDGQVILWPAEPTTGISEDLFQ